MKKIFTLLSILFILSWCYNIDDHNDDFIFEKNKECASFKSDMIVDINDEFSDDSEAELHKIFYSEKLNSCLYVVKYITPWCPPYWLTDTPLFEERYKTLHCHLKSSALINFFTKERIFSSSPNMYFSCLNSYDKDIGISRDEYKKRCEENYNYDYKIKNY